MTCISQSRARRDSAGLQGLAEADPSAWAGVSGLTDIGGTHVLEMSGTLEKGDFASHIRKCAWR